MLLFRLFPLFSYSPEVGAEDLLLLSPLDKNSPDVTSLFSTGQRALWPSCHLHPLSMLHEILEGADASRLALHMGTTGLWIIEVENTLVYSSKLLSLLP